MLSKRQRITKSLFDTVLKEGKFLNSPSFTLRFIVKKGEVPRIAFVAPKGILKFASQRNSFRRKGYNVLPLQIPPIFGIFFYKKAGITKSTQEIKDEILSLLSQIKF